MGTVVIGRRDAESLRAAAAHLPGLDTAVSEEWPEGVTSVLPARLLPPLIANLYAAINELMDAFRLDGPRLRAAEPFAPDDFWIPGYSYRENLVLLCGLPLHDDANVEPSTRQ
jgi:hypothetical protein